MANPAATIDGNVSGNEIPTALVDYLEFYLLNYFKPATYKQTADDAPGPADVHGRSAAPPATCRTFTIDTTAAWRTSRPSYDPERGILNGLFATATPLFDVRADGGRSIRRVKRALGQPFVVRNIFTDFKRHDLGPDFHERNWDGTMQKEFLTRPLWGVGTQGAFGHDGRSINLAEVILRHGGEAQSQRERLRGAAASRTAGAVLDFLSSLVLFPPDDTASNLDPGDRDAAELSAGRATAASG